MIYFCSQSNRRELVLQSPLNGIDYLEVLGDPGCGTQLAVTFLKEKFAWNYLVAFGFLGVAAFFAFAVKPSGLTT